MNEALWLIGGDQLRAGNRGRLTGRSITRNIVGTEQWEVSHTDERTVLGSQLNVAPLPKEGIS